MKAHRAASLHILDQVKIASPCNASWDAMSGDDRARFCGQCNKHVYNFAAMTTAQIEALIIEKEGQLCGRLYRRADGAILTADCPVGLAAVRRKAVRLLAFAAALLLGAINVFAYIAPSGARARLRQFEPFAAIANRLSPAPATPVLPGNFLAGAIVLPSPPTTQVLNNGEASSPQQSAKVE
jgi:hypothetical protein